MKWLLAFVTKKEPAVVGGALGSVAQILIEQPDWSHAWHALIGLGTGILIRKFVSPANSP